MINKSEYTLTTPDVDRCFDFGTVGGEEAPNSSFKKTKNRAREEEGQIETTL